MAKRFAVKFTDETLVAAMKAAADEQRVPIVQWATEAMRRALLPSSAAGCVRCEDLKERGRQRYRRQRQDAGKPAHVKREPFRTTGVLLPRTCPLCDTVFTPPIRAQHQKYCNKLCTRYAFTYNHDMKIARPAYAAFMLRRQQGSKR